MIKVIFVCLISCCSWFMPLKDNLSIINQEQMQEVETKQRKESFIYNSIGYYGSSDISSYYFLTSLINYFIQTYGSTYDDLTLDNDNYASIQLSTPNAFNFTMYNPSSNSYQDVFTANSVKFSKFNQGNPYNNAYTLSFTGFLNMQMNYYWYVQQTSSLPTFVIGFACNGSSDLQQLHEQSELSERGAIKEYATQYAFLGKVTNNMFSERDSIVYERGVQAGRNEGYDSGVADGYQQGYDAGQQAGYSEGIAYAQEQSSTTFT